MFSTLAINIGGGIISAIADIVWEINDLYYEIYNKREILFQETKKKHFIEKLRIMKSKKGIGWPIRKVKAPYSVDSVCPLYLLRAGHSWTRKNSMIGRMQKLE